MGLEEGEAGEGLPFALWTFARRLPS